MEVRDTAHLRILLANERRDRLDLLAGIIDGMGHEVVGREIDVSAVGALTAKTRPDVAIVGLGESSEHALDHVSAIVREAFCPVIAVLPAHDPEWVAEASKRGLYAYLLDDRPAELQSAVDITLRRYADYHALRGAFDRSNEAAAREEKSAQAKQRQALELHDEIVQGLAVADLALKLGRDGESQAALTATLERARSIVTRELTELQSKGHTLEQLIGDTSRGTAGG
ncbi:MAG: response regulator receiver and domain protein [Actinomycetia bacterium]|jgi:AmiR/NasT family two-component response regulator|nr:response regulator receiver and domain protein [Actinomycetes bacterium]